MRESKSRLANSLMCLRIKYKESMCWRNGWKWEEMSGQVRLVHEFQNFLCQWNKEANFLFIIPNFLQACTTIKLWLAKHNGKRIVAGSLSLPGQWR